METIAWLEKYMSEAEIMINEGRVDEGVRALNELLFDEPGYARLHNHLGWAYMYYVKDAARAEMHFRMAVRFAPEFAPPYLHMGTCMNSSGRYSEALEYFSAGVTKPEAIRTALYEGMACSYEMMREYGKAIRAYKEAASATSVDFEVERVLKSAKRCRRKRIALFFSF
jgi:tetratricopeptide (TPR) repeat protein